MSTSHEWAKDLQKTAEFLLSRPEVEIGRIPRTQYFAFSEKEPFLAMVRATKPGSKEMTEYYINFLPSGANLEISVNRDLFCKRLNPVYECEPLLSPEEDAEMETTTEEVSDIPF